MPRLKSTPLYKSCRVCKIIKPLKDFYRNKHLFDGRTGECAECRRKLRNTPREKERIKNYVKSYREKDPNYRKAQTKEYNRRPEVQARLKEYRKAYRPKAREAERRYWQNSERCRIRRNLCARLKRCLEEGKIVGRLVDLIGCPYEQLRIHIESLWKPGMTWDNRGFGPGKWCMDHIIPCAAYDLTDLEQQRKAFHYTNLQPLWYEENAEKSDYLTIDGKIVRARDFDTPPYAETKQP